MLSISAIADADYYLGSGSGGACCVRTKASPADYELDGVAAGEPPGEWLWRGENRLGLTGQIHAQGASGDAFRLLVNELRDPTRPAGADGQRPHLGRAPQTFKTVAARVAAFTTKHPAATPEEIAAFRMSALADQRQANNAWDAVFSPPKSWSVLHAALQWAGRRDEAAVLWECVQAGVDAALTELHEQLSFVQSKPTGPEIGGRRTARYERATNLQAATFRHHKSRDGDPQMHVHTMILNRWLDQQGRWRAMYSPAVLRAKHGLDQVFLRAAEGEATRRLGLMFAATEDGTSREIVGVSRDVREFFSSRSRAVTADAQEAVDVFTAERGRAPTQRERWLILQESTKRTRRAKDPNAPGREEQLERWEESVRARTRASLADILEEVDAARALPGDPVVVTAWSPGEVIELALADLERSKSVWNTSHLAAAISRRLPDMVAADPAAVGALLRDLVEQAAAHPAVVTTEAAAAVPVPRGLLDPQTGRSVFEAPDGRRFTTRGTLGREESLIGRLDQRGAPTVPPSRAAELVEGSGLSAEQDAVVVAALTSGRWMEVVDAAAGTGKSTTMRVLSQACEKQWGVGVVGFAVAENAAQVLRGQGLARAFNIAQFRHFLDRETRGEVSDAERVQFALARGSTVVVDEASTVDTAELVGLLGDLDRLGVGKVVLVGDRAQADPVDAGGGFAMLVDELEGRRVRAAREQARQLALPPGQSELTAVAMSAWTGDPAPQQPRELEQVLALRQVRRFDAPWERVASAKIRGGDSVALHQYATRGRVHGSTDSGEVRDAAVRGFVADWLSGHDSMIVTATGEAAADAASRARRALVDAGHVEAGGVELRDDTLAGIGDMIQTRENDRDVGAINRQRWQVVGRCDDGALEVRAELHRGAAPNADQGWGPVHTLPAHYVTRQVELAYAGTVHAVEGTTVRGTSHTIVTRSMGRSHAYVGLTRATSANHAYCELAGEHETPVSRLAAVIGRDDHQPAATSAIAVEQDRATHLGHLGPQWEAVVRETRAAAHRQMLMDTLGDDAAAVIADRAVHRLYGLLRGAELSGHEPREVLEACAARGRLDQVRSPAAVLYARISDEMKTGPLARAVPVGFAARTPNPARGDVENERLEYARGLGTVMDRRAADLAELAALDAPTWAVRTLGPVPDDPAGRAAWVGRVALACAYRERYGLDDDESALGRRPPHAEPERGWLWDTAARLLGVPDHERTLAGLSDTDLADLQVQWQRALAWMPRNVDRDLLHAHTALDEARRQLVDARIAGRDPGERESDVAAMTGWVAALEEVAAVRAEAYQRCADVRDRASDADNELHRRAEIEAARQGRLHPDDPGPDEPDADIDENPELDHDPGGAVEVDTDPAVHAAVLAHMQRTFPQQPADVPALGSWSWVDLDDTDPAKWAAVERAALAWWRAGEPLSLDQARLLNDRLDEARRDIGTSADLDLDRMAAVARYAGPRLGAAPVFGTREWAELDDDGPQRQRATLAAALTEWNAGDVPLSQLADVVDAGEAKAAAIAVSVELARQNSTRGWDHRSHFDVEQERELSAAELEREQGEERRALDAEARAAQAAARAAAQHRQLAADDTDTAAPAPLGARVREDLLAAARDHAQHVEPDDAAEPERARHVVVDAGDVDEDPDVEPDPDHDPEGQALRGDALAVELAKARAAAELLAQMRAREVEDELRAHDEEMRRSLEVLHDVDDPQTQLAT